MYNTAKEKYLELMDNLVETMKSLEELMDSDEFIEWHTDSEDEDRPQYTNHNKQVQEILDQMVASGEVVMSVDENGEILYTKATVTEK
jgi:hypothetical protein